MFEAYLFDLDGTVYRGKNAIEGAPEFFRELQKNGFPYLFITNRCNRLPQTISDHLNTLGIPCRAENVLTSAHAASSFLEGKSAFVIGEIGLTQILREKNVRITENQPEAVVVGFDEGINYKKLEMATRLILNGAQFIATNTDSCINTETGISPENGPIVAAIQNATGVKPYVVGKPAPCLIEEAEKHLKISKKKMIIVGDNPDTDILCGINAGISSALILTGITTKAEAPKRVNADIPVIENYIELKKFLDGSIKK